jgi:hypothetical protein
MQGLVLGELKIDVSDAPGLLVQKWTGASNNRDPSTGLRPFLEVSIAEATTKRLALELHFEELTYFNSSTVATLLRFLEKARKMGVKVILHYDGSQRWQAHNFEAIALLHRDEKVEVHRVDKGEAPERVG